MYNPKDIIDIIAVLEKFRGAPFAPATWRVDLVGIGHSKIGCAADQRIDIVDVAAAVEAFKNISFNQLTGCPVPCP